MVENEIRRKRNEEWGEKGGWWEHVEKKEEGIRKKDEE